MALEWVVSDGRPTYPDELIPLIEASFERYFQRGVSQQRDEASLGSAENEFSTVLELSVDGEAARVHLDQMSYDEATGTCFGYVEADRTGLSVAAGIVAAVCWNARSGGRLSGTAPFTGRRETRVTHSAGIATWGPVLDVAGWTIPAVRRVGQDRWSPGVRCS